MLETNIIKEIIDTVSIVDVISSYIKLQKKGANYWAVCPFHNDSNPSLSVSPSKKYFKCFVCGTSGNVIDFVQKYNKITKNEAILLLCKQYNIDITKYNLSFENKNYLVNKPLFDLTKQASEWYKLFLFDTKYKFALEYLKKRKIDDETIKYFGIGYSPKNNEIFNLSTNHDNILGEGYKPTWNEQQLLDTCLIGKNEKGFFDFFRERIIFPIKDIDGNIVGFSGRVLDNSEPKYLNSSDSKIFKKNEILYNIQNIEKETETIILCEGYMDVIGFYRAGIKNAVACMGTSLTTNQIKILKKLNIKNIIISFDNDNAGLYASIKIGETLLNDKFNVYAINYFDIKQKDVDELMNNLGSETVKKCINECHDYISMYITNKIKNISNNAEKLSTINSVILFVKKYADKLLASKYAKLISSCANIEYEDVYKKITGTFSYEVNDKANDTIYIKNDKLLFDSFNEILKWNKMKINNFILFFLNELKFRKIKNYDYFGEIFEILLIKNITYDEIISIAKKNNINEDFLIQKDTLHVYQFEDIKIEQINNTLYSFINNILNLLKPNFSSFDFFNFKNEIKKRLDLMLN